jgi:hypothetical protein
VKTTEELHRDKIERETHEILLLGKANNRLLTEQNAKLELLTQTTSDNARAVLEFRGALDRLTVQVSGCRADLTKLNGLPDEFDRFEAKLDDVATEIGNLWRLLNERLLLPQESAQIKTTIEDAAEPLASRADR